MSYRQTTLITIALIALAALVLGGLTWVNYRYSVQNPGGNDFLPRWLGTRLFLTEGLDPYSPQVTREIQRMVYGRPARSGEDRVLFVYPFYSFIVFAPFALVEDYTLARALWMTALEVALGLIAILGISLSNWKPRPYMLVLILLFSLLWYHGLRPVINGNASVIVALLIALAFACIRAEQDALAGFLLALATIKPQMLVLLIPFVLLWAISHGRWALFWTTLGSLFLLSAGASLFIPNWLMENLQQVLAYPQYTQPGTPGSVLYSMLPGIGRQVGWGLTGLMAVVLLVEWFLAWGKDFRWFFWAACLALVATNLIGVPTTTENYTALFPGLVLVFATWDQRWGRIGRWLVLASILLLFFGLWALFLKTLIPTDQPWQHPVMFLPFPAFLFAGLYWVRWWSTHPPRVLLDHLQFSQRVEPE